MSVTLGAGDFTTASDGLLELKEDVLRSIMRTEPITDIYHVEQTPFARGKFASVRKIRHLETGVEYAAKFIRKRRRAADSSREIHHEVAVLALCGGADRVVRLHEVYDTRSEVAIVLELAGGGELQRILDEEERMHEGAARRALRHALEGLRHLHARSIAHLDLKPQNLLLTHSGRDLLICDFGISRAIRPGAIVREILGTRDYVAPEILSYEPISLAADIWSVGVLAYVLLSGYSPFAGATKQETYLNIAQCTLTFPAELFDDVSETALDFIRATLVLEPRGRLTVEQCLEHPWLRDEKRIPLAIIGAESATVHNGAHNGTHNGAPLSVHDNDDTHTNGHDPKDAVENGTEKNGLDRNGKENGIANGKENGADCVEGGFDELEERERAIEKYLKHPHGRENSPPFPDAPSTPKVSRKSSHTSPPSVLALCKKFQPDFQEKHPERERESAPASKRERENGANTTTNNNTNTSTSTNKKHSICGCECAECHARCLRALPPDRAIIC